MWGICHSAYAKDAPWHTLEFLLLLVNEFKLATKEFDCFVAETLPYPLRKKIITPVAIYSCKNRSEQKVGHYCPLTSTYNVTLWRIRATIVDVEN